MITTRCRPWVLYAIVSAVLFLTSCSGGGSDGGSSSNTTSNTTVPAPSNPPSTPDTTAPSTPGNLTAAAAGPTQVNLSWNASTDNIAVASYQIFRGSSSTPLAQTSARSYSDATVTANTSYSYRVRAVDTSNNISAMSAAVNVTTPTAPVGGCAFPNLPASDCNPWLPTPASGKTWQLSFSEEFNGSDYDRTKLTPCFDWNYGGCTSSFNQGREHYAASQIQVGGGVAKLVAQPTSPPIASNGCQNGQCTYLSGLLSTARPRADNGSDYLYKFTYGYVEAKLKLIGTQGFFTAFWMLPTNTSYVYRTEIDILEHLGHDPVTMFMTYHYNDRGDSYNVNNSVGHNGNCPAIDYTTGFHRFGVDWQPTYIAWYIDGVKCAQFNGNSTTIENGPMQIILDVMVDNTWQRSWNKGLLDPTLTRSLEVDYIRVFQQR